MAQKCLIRSGECFQNEIQPFHLDKNHADLVFILRDGKLSSRRLILAKYSKLVNKIIFAEEGSRYSMGSEKTVLICKDVSKKTMLNLTKLIFKGDIRLRSRSEMDDLLSLFQLLEISLGHL